MKGSTIALDEIGGRRAAARIVDGQLDDFLVDPPEGLIRSGSVFRAIPDRPMKGQGGVMVRLTDGRTGFLRQTNGLAPGRPLLVQVTGYAEAGKAPPVTTRIAFRSRYVVVTPGAPGVNISRQIADADLRAALGDAAAEVALPEDCGLIVRSAAEGAAIDAVTEDIRAIVALAGAVLGDAGGSGPELLVEGEDAHELAWRDWDADEVDARPGSFGRHGVHEMLDRLASPHVALPSGAFMVVEETRALVAVDVNTGSDTSPAAALRANIAAAKALPRVLRCRGLGGQVTIDPAPLSKRDRKPFETSLKAALKADPVDTVLAGWTPLGHFELQRRRERAPLPEGLG